MALLSLSEPIRLLSFLHFDKEIFLLCSDDEIVLKFRVSDTGIGIAEEKLEHIFHSFSQADASTTRQFGGSGLGLTIASQLVDLMGGHITATSTVGEGSCFTVWLPSA